MDKDKDKELNLDILQHIKYHLRDVNSQFGEGDRHANISVICHVCGQRLKDGVPYSALYHKTDHTMRPVNWCQDCDKIVRSSSDSREDYMKEEFRSALDQFINRVKPIGD